MPVPDNRLSWRRDRIDGTLTTKSPLHIGTCVERLEQIDGQDVKVMGVITDAAHRAYVPGSTLKGVLHQWALNVTEEDNALRNIVYELFGVGKGPVEDGEERGGRLIFRDARTSADPLMPKPYIMASTVIDRVTRTAEHNKLYHFEAVPPETKFNVTICGEALTDDELAFLLVALDQFKDTGSLKVGGFTAFGFGSMAWGIIKRTGFREKKKVKLWLKNKACSFDSMPEIDGANEKILNKLDDDIKKKVVRSASFLTLNLKINFEGPFLINDPSRCIKADPAKGISEENSISHNYLKDVNGKAALTAKSFKGAVRSQAERITRTLFPPDSPGSLSFKKDNSAINPIMACYINSRDRACLPITEKGELEQLCLVCRLFGGSGWKAPVTFSDFTSSFHDGEYECTQEFVAIDRFTGGAATGQKFKACYRFKPAFTGSIHFDLDRIGPEHIGLLILTLKDLIEGDISFGFGRSKGFGACRASIKEIKPPGKYPSWITEMLPDIKHENISKLFSVSLPLDNSRITLLKKLIETFVSERR
jgi:CRISPR/Cas system CSM-associated protein Csm3 (group 7 of RAMP superfamily)